MELEFHPIEEKLTKLEEALAIAGILIKEESLIK